MFCFMQFDYEIKNMYALPTVSLGKKYFSWIKIFIFNQLTASVHRVATTFKYLQGHKKCGTNNYKYKLASQIAEHEVWISKNGRDRGTLRTKMKGKRNLHFIEIHHLFSWEYAYYEGIYWLWKIFLLTFTHHSPGVLQTVIWHFCIKNHFATEKEVKV